MVQTRPAAPARFEPQDLGDGLVMRCARPDDADALAAFNGDIHREPGQAEPSAWVMTWTRDLMTRPHPTFAVEDFLIVEEMATRKIVSTLNLISQTWSYGGIEIGVGRPELVGTDPAYRRRGLVRRQFDVIHRWSAERGELVQAITGIPWYYRQFGYEMALDHAGGRPMPRSAVPKLEDGQSEPFRIRPATADDVPFIVDVDSSSRGRYLVTAVRTADLWRMELDGRSDRVLPYVAIVESLDSARVGFVVHNRRRWGGSFNVLMYELAPSASWLAVTPTVVRYLADRATAAPTHDESAEPFATLNFWLGQQHPLYEIVEQRTRQVPPYAFYVRVPDLPAFLRRVAPVLEDRLASSVARGHTGELRLSFYRSGVILRFDAGRLADVEAFTPPQHIKSAAWFPELTFLSLLFGRRSRKELEYAFPDCHSHGDDVPVLLDILFPKLPSRVWPIM